MPRPPHHVYLIVLIILCEKYRPDTVTVAIFSQKVGHVSGTVKVSYVTYDVCIHLDGTAIKGS
jgi:hypothetical protein